MTRLSLAVLLALTAAPAFADATKEQIAMKHKD